MATDSVPKKTTRTGWYIAAVIIIIAIIAVGVILYEQHVGPSTPASTPIAMTIYAGEVNSTTYGFGNSTSSLTSPGPALTFKEGQPYSMTVYNVGTMLHSWALSTTPNLSGQILFNSEINPGTYISPGQSASVTFTPTETGSFYYICPVPGHTALGMWGTATVSS